MKNLLSLDLLKTNALFVLTGDVNSGKSGFLFDWYYSLTSENQKKVGGFITKGYFKDNKKHYKSLDLYNNIWLDITQNIPPGKEVKIGKFTLNQASFDSLNHSLKCSLNKKEIFIIDEFGPLELQEKGLWRGVKTVLKAKKTIIMVIRKKILYKALDKIQNFHL